MTDLPHPDRAKIIKISFEALLAFLMLDGSKKVKVLGLPADSVIDAIKVEYPTSSVWLRVLSKEFPQLAPMQSPSDLDLTVTAIPFELGESKVKFREFF